MALLRARLSLLLHLQLQILWFQVEDIAVIAVSYTLWLMLDSWRWIWIVVALPWLVMTIKAEKPRGYLRHVLYGIGLQKLEHYPRPDIEVFHE
jgi:hypothetical protein